MVLLASASLLTSSRILFLYTMPLAAAQNCMRLCAQRCPAHFVGQGAVSTSTVKEKIEPLDQKVGRTLGLLMETVPQGGS